MGKILYHSMSFRSLPRTYDWAQHEHEAFGSYILGLMQVQAGEVVRCGVLYLAHEEQALACDDCGG